jgi:hypothetical protein
MTESRREFGDESRLSELDNTDGVVPSSGDRMILFQLVNVDPRAIIYGVPRTAKFRRKPLGL